MLVTQQAAGVFKVRWAALPEALCLLAFQIQHVQEGPVALRRCPRPCITGIQKTLQTWRSLTTTNLGFLVTCKAMHAVMLGENKIPKLFANPSTASSASNSTRSVRQVRIMEFTHYARAVAIRA